MKWNDGRHARWFFGKSACGVLFAMLCLTAVLAGTGEAGRLYPASVGNGAAEVRGQGITDRAARESGSTGKAGQRAPKVNHKPLVLAEWNVPMPTILGDPQLHARLESIFVTTRNAFGMVRRINLVQCHQFHTNPSPERLMAKSAKQAEDGKAEASEKGEGGGMCLGMASGFLASHFAIRAMYGNKIPDIEDFTLGSNCPMAGVWDSLNLINAKYLTRGNPDSAPSRGAFVFTITRAADGRSKTFTFAKEYQKQFDRFFDMKWHPEKYLDAQSEIRQLQEAMIRSLLTRFARGDYGYFVEVETNG